MHLRAMPAQPIRLEIRPGHRNIHHDVPARAERHSEPPRERGMAADRLSPERKCVSGLAVPAEVVA